MKFKDALSKAITIINDNSIALDTQSEKRDRFISCGETIVNELIALYASPVKEEEVTFINGRAEFSNFSQKVKEILAVRQHGVSLNFTVANTYLNADVNGRAVVKYKYFPMISGIEDELDLPAQLTEDTLALGIAAEYFYRLGFTDEAAFYKNRYDIALVNLIKTKNSFILKVKRMV